MSTTTTQPCDTTAPAFCVFSHAYCRLCDRCCARVAAEVQNNPGGYECDVTSAAQKRRGKCVDCGAFGRLYMILVWHFMPDQVESEVDGVYAVDMGHGLVCNICHGRWPGVHVNHRRDCAGLPKDFSD